MSYLLYLDDVWDPEDPFTHVFVVLHSQAKKRNLEIKWVKSTQEAINLINEIGLPSFMSLDHDLSGDDRAIDFINWLYNAYPNSVIDFHVHSANVIGKANIESFMNSWHKSLL